jgi:hypothetical protein
VYPKVTGLAAGAGTANGTALCHYVQLYRYFVSQYTYFIIIIIIIIIIIFLQGIGQRPVPVQKFNF